MGVESAPKFFKPCQVSEVAKQPVLDPCESDGGSNTDTGRTSERRRNLPLRVRGVSRSRPNPSGKQTTNRTSRPPREPKENIREEFVPMDSSGHTEDARRDKRAPDARLVVSIASAVYQMSLKLLGRLILNLKVRKKGPLRRATARCSLAGIVRNRSTTGMTQPRSSLHRLTLRQLTLRLLMMRLETRRVCAFDFIAPCVCQWSLSPTFKQSVFAAAMPMLKPRILHFSLPMS